MCGQTKKVRSEMFDWIIKKVVCGKINSLLKDNQQNVVKMRTTLKLWVGRLKNVLSCFESLLEKIDDNELSSDELRQTAEEVNTLVKEW